MDGDTRPRPSPEARYELLYRLLIIAAIAVIMVSLVGIASMTGLLPRVGEAKPNAEMIRPRDEAARTDTGGTMQKQPSLRAVPVHRQSVVCDVCAAAEDSTVHSERRRAATLG